MHYSNFVLAGFVTFALALVFVLLLHQIFEKRKLKKMMPCKGVIAGFTKERHPKRKSKETVYVNVIYFAEGDMYQTKIKKRIPKSSYGQIVDMYYNIETPEIVYFENEIWKDITLLTIVFLCLTPIALFVNIYFRMTHM